ncbi:DEAD/DEAH box helicase family protein [Streptomyces sp. SYSU K21746]
MAALEALRVLEGERRPASEQEQRVLARWSGWGALPVIFNPRPAREAFDADDAYERAAARWDAVGDMREQIQTLLTEDEWAAARRNTINAHYTDADLVRSIWGAVRGLGFKGGRVLEPGSGSGNFIGFAPVLMRDPVQMTGVEVEPTTAAIARRLYPDAEIITSGLEEIPLADGGFDGVVGNVPFGRYKRFDKVHNADLKLSIHDHFVLKSLYATRPGGIVALITSRYTLDAESPEARERMYQLGDLVGAVRLPARAHMAAAGTDVVTDVLFLRRRMDGEEPGDATWLTATKRALPGHDDELAVNTYFDAHPEYVLGELRAGSREWGPDVTVVGRTDQTPAESLAAAAAAIAVEAEAAALTAVADQRTEPVQTIVTGGTEDALGLDAEGNPTIIDGGRPVPLEVHPDQREQLVKLIRLKSLTLALYEAEAATPEPGETPQLARLRAELRVGWRDYRKGHPPLTKPRQHYKFTPAEARARATAQGLKDVPEGWKARTAFAWIDDDPDASLLFGLEEWDERTGKGTEQQVLLSRVLEPRRLPVRATSHEDAIALAMEYDGGRLDMARVAGLLGTDAESAAAQVADAGLAYRDPEQNNAWEPSHRYLSGNVRTKLAAAKKQAVGDPTFLGNVAALERVQPSDLAPSEIKAKIGAPWIPVDVYNDFLAHLGFEDASVLHAGGTVWEVRGAKSGDLARTEWGTGSRPTQDLFTALLRQTESTIQVTYRDNEGRTYVDKDATDAAQEKAKLIAEAFEDWVWNDKSRAARLAKLYNEMFNNLVLPDYSGSALTLPGLISDWTMKEHQNAAIRRIVHEPTALLAHVVGAGKTATMAAGAMELRRTGLAKKPALVVPNHMLKQWTREFRQLYPNAKILAISASDLNVKRRAKFMGRIAGGEWDAVILTHEAFNRVPLRPDNMRTYLDQEMRSLRSQLDIAAESGMGRNTVKQIEESLANAEAKLQQQIESMGDDNGVFLEDTGVDYLFLDEAHEYKNLRTVSAIPGAAIQGSAKATKLHMVLSWLRETNESERVATLATGTPIANSVTEAYVLKRYLAPKLLEDMGLDAFDNWAATFGEVVSNLEPDPKGDGYKYKARFSRFFNVPELMGAYRTFADVQMAEDLDLPTPPVRENEDGQRGETVLIPPTPAQREFIKQLPHKPWVRKPGGVLKALGEGLRASVDLDLVDATDALRGLGINPNQITSTDPMTGGPVLDYTKVAELADAAATDMRSIGGSKDMGSKIPYAAEKITEIWHETKDIVYPISSDNPNPQDLPGGLQLVFLDEGTPGSTAKHSANLYADLRDELVARGMPRDSIRFIHEAGTDRKKEKLFADCRAGRVRVLIGSTQKMGTGTNIQDRAVALHHLSYPWRPADMAQRDGRIERRGNLNAPWVDNTPDDVRVLYYITERTFDEFRLTTLARKARFIGQIQRRDFSMREIEDIGADALNIGMLAALASGDPAILQLAEATAERSRLQGLARSWDRAQDSRSQQLKDIDDFLGRADFALERMREAAPNRRPTNGDAFAMTVDDATYRSRDTAANALGARMAAIAGDQSIRPGQRIPVGTLGRQDFHAEIAYGSSGRRQLRLRFAWGHVVPMGQREDRAQWQASTVTPSNGRGAIQSLEHFLNHLDGDLEKLDASAASQRGRREEIAANLRLKDDNPYRIQARSKERQERALGKLVVANEKEAALAERVERAGSVSEEAAEEGNEELTALREQIAALRKVITDEDELQARAQGLVQPDRDDTASEPASSEETAQPEAAADTSAPANTADRQEVPGEPQEQPGTEQPGTDVGTSAESQEVPAPEESREQRFREAVEDLFSGTAPGPGEPGSQDEEPAAGDDDPIIDQMIAQDMAAMAGAGWTEVVQPFASQSEAMVEREHVQAVYEGWAATQTALPMLVDAEGELTDEDSRITNPAGLVASWQHRSRVAAETAGPTGGRMVVEQFEGLAQAARRADTYLAERDAYATERDRALLLRVADVAGRYAQRLSATLDVLAQQRAGERQESQAEVHMIEVRALESVMEYLGDQGADFRMDRRNATITDREAAGTQLRDDLLRTMSEFADLPPERQNINPDFRLMYASIRGIPLYVGWSGIGTPEAQAVLGFDLLPLLDRDSITAAELEAMTPTQLIDRLDGKLALDALGTVRDRELAAVQDLLAAGAQGQQGTRTDDAPTTETRGPNADPEQLDPWWEASSDEAVPDGHQPFTDSSVQLVPGDTVRAGWRMYMEDRQLHYHTVTIEEGPDPRDGYYVGRNEDGLRRRLHPRNIVAVPDGSRLLPGNAPAPEETPAPAPAEAQTTEAAPHQGLIDALGDRVSLTHIGGPQPDAEPAEEPAAPVPTEAEEHTEPSPEMARSAAVLRYYEPLLKRHKLSGKDVVAYIDRPGVGYTYDPDNPLLDLVHEIGKVGERVGGSFRISYNEWVNYQVGDKRAAQSEQLTNLSLDLYTLYGGETEPLFEVDLESILAAPPGAVIDLPEETAREQAPSAIVINHDAEGTTVKGTRGDDQPVRNALKEQGFRWSRRQSVWYQRRDTPLDAREDAVRGLRDFLDRMGTAYTYNGPEPAPQDTEESTKAPQETTPAAATGTEPAEPSLPAAVEASETTAEPGSDPGTETDTSPGVAVPGPGPGTDEPQPVPPADAETDVPAPAAADDAADSDADEEADDPDEAAADGETDAENTVIVQTPDGPGRVIGTDGDLVLVSTQSGTRVYEGAEVQWPDGTARPEDGEWAARRRQNAADLAQASTAEGIELRYGDGNRLVDLDVEAGHGTVVDADGAVVGWVRARLGDDGRRYWWGQDARGGAPDDMPFHEALPPSAGVPAIRAAGNVRTDKNAVKEPAHRGPISAEYAFREVRLTTAQVRELRQLTLDSSYSDGTPVEPPEWVAAHRKYHLNVAQMQALGEAAQAAADAFPGITAEERRTAKVLRNAAERFEFEVYDTARWRATIPPIGESDPYAGPYQPRPRTEVAEEQQAAPDTPAPSAEPAPAVTEAAADAPADGGELEPTAAAAEPGPAPTDEPDLEAAAHLVGPAPYWRIVGAETDDQATVRFGGPERLRAFAARVQVVPAPSALTETSADVWMDGRMIGRISDLNDVGEPTGSGAQPLWSAEPIFGTIERRLSGLARFRSQEAALAELAVRALRTGPPIPDRLDEDMTASFTRHLVRPNTGIPSLPDAMSGDAAAAARHAELADILAAFEQGSSNSGSIAEDLAVAHDSLLWLSATQPDADVRDDLETRADTISTYLNYFRPEDPRAAQNRVSDPPDTAVPDRTAAADSASETTGAAEEEGQLDLFPTETPDAPAPRRPARRRGGKRTEPAIPPGTDGGPEKGRLGVYGHADHGECERCGTPDTARYTVVWHWYGRDEISGDMAAECAPCVELTTGLAYQEIARLADAAEVRRGGRRIQPGPYPERDVTVARTADNEWTSVHLPTGKRYRSAQESESGYRGYVTRDLHGVSYGVGPDVSVAREIATRAALGHTAETHPNAGDNWVYFGYRQDCKAAPLYEGETITVRIDGRRLRGPYEHGPRWDLTVAGFAYVVEMVYQQGQPGDDGHRLVVTGPDQTSARYVQWDGVLEWAREHARGAEAGRSSTLTAAPIEAPAPAEQEALAEGETAADDGQLSLVEPADAPPAPAPAAGGPGADAAVEEPAPDTVPVNEPIAEAAAQDDAPVPDREPDGEPDQEDAVADEPDPASVTTDVPAADPPSAVAVGDSPVLDVEDPPAPRSYTEVFPLPADAAYQLHLTGLEGQGPNEGELRYGETTIAAVRLSASGRWFARLTVDGLPADVTALNGSPQDAAGQGAVMFAAFSGTPYGVQPGAAADYGSLTRADVLRGELRAAALGHLDTITVAVARVSADYTQIPQFQELSARLNDLAAAEIDAHNSRQMAANLDAVQQAVNAWGGTLPVDPALDERQHLAFPLAHLLHDTTRLHARLQATLDAVQAERTALQREQEAAAAAAPAEPAREESVQQTPPPPAAPEPVRGPVVVLGLREASEGQLVAMVNTEDASQALVLPGVTSADLPGMPMPVRVEVPMLMRTAQQAEHLVSDEETQAWLAEHLPGGPLAQAWSSDAVRATLVVVVRDVLREGMAPSVDEVAAWLVTTAAEQDGLLQAAQAAATVEDFAPQFARAADALVANTGGSEFLLWTYLGDEGARRIQVLALATQSAYEQLRVLPAPADAPGPERAPTPIENEPPAPSPEAPEDPEMAAPARPAKPESSEPAAPTSADTGAAAEPGDQKPELTEIAEPAAPAPTGELPLWTGPEETSEQTEDRPVDVVAEFAGVQEAWDEHVPADKGTSEDLFADVQADLLKLQQMLADAVAETAPAPEAPPVTTVQPAAAAESAPAPATAPPSGEQEAPKADRDPQKEAGAVNTALRQADEHAPALQDLPEWQRIQTVRGAFGNLMRVIKERAGEHLDKLMGDGRVADFFRRVSLRACEKVAGWAQAGADRLRRDDERGTEQREDLPSTDALLRLGDAALEYSGPRRGGTPPPPASGAPDAVDIPAMRRMGEALNRPMPGDTKRVSTAAARGRSTTTAKRGAKGAKKSANGSEQAEHLRRSGEQQQATKPNQQR